ncbi:competence protein ComJ [Paenibacillus sp. CMAA1364]
MIEETQKVQLQISHHQIQVRSRVFDEAACQWGNGNIEQGVIIHPGCVTFDPIFEGSQNIDIWLTLKESFGVDAHTQRCFVVPFEVIDHSELKVLSVGTALPIQLPLEQKGIYDLYYEVCEDENIYYKFTFVPTDVPIQARICLDDEWGGVAEQILQDGYVEI